jgi:hypothetical protein
MEIKRNVQKCVFKDVSSDDFEMMKMYSRGKRVLLFMLTEDLNK